MVKYSTDLMSLAFEGYDEGTAKGRSDYEARVDSANAACDMSAFADMRGRHPSIDDCGKWRYKPLKANIKRKTRNDDYDAH